MIENPPHVFESVRTTANKMGIPFAWLLKEVKADRIPCLHAGKVHLLHQPTVEQHLLNEMRKKMTKPSE